MIWQVSDGAPRFTMLETLREFAADRLDKAGEIDSARDRHAMFHLDFAEREKVRFAGPDPGAALNRVAIDHDNIRAAPAYLLEK